MHIVVFWRRSLLIWLFLLLVCQLYSSHSLGRRCVLFSYNLPPIGLLCLVSFPSLLFVCGLCRAMLHIDLFFDSLLLSVLFLALLLPILFALHRLSCPFPLFLCSSSFSFSRSCSSRRRRSFFASPHALSCSFPPGAFSLLVLFAFVFLGPLFRLSFFRLLFFSRVFCSPIRFFCSFQSFVVFFPLFLIEFPFCPSCSLGRLDLIRHRGNVLASIFSAPVSS